MKLGEKIRYLREVEGSLRGLQRDLSQQEMVRAIEAETGSKLSQSYLSQIESGSRPHLTNTTRQILAKFFKVHPGYLVDDPEGYHPELLSEVRNLEDKLDLWLVSGAERFRREVESHFARRAAGGEPAALTVSGGIASYPEDASDAEALLARAAQALYQAKAAGKNAVLLHTPERRRFLRFDLGGRHAEVEVVGARDLAGGRVRNTSGSGLLFTSPEPIDVGEGIEIRLEGGGGAKPRRVLTLRGRVVRLEELPSAEDERFEVGVAFDPEGAPPEGDLLEFLEGAASGRPDEA